MNWYPAYSVLRLEGLPSVEGPCTHESAVRLELIYADFAVTVSGNLVYGAYYPSDGRMHAMVVPGIQRDVGEESACKAPCVARRQEVRDCSFDALERDDCTWRDAPRACVPPVGGANHDGGVEHPCDGPLPRIDVSGE